MSNSEALSSLKELTHAAEQYYKWVNQFDIRIEDVKLRSAIAKAKNVIDREGKSNSA